MRRILKTLAAAACVDVAARPLLGPVFVFVFTFAIAFFISFKGINQMKFVAQL